jgi:hypothetical protein
VSTTCAGDIGDRRWASIFTVGMDSHPRRIRRTADLDAHVLDAVRHRVGARVRFHAGAISEWIEDPRVWSRVARAQSSRRIDDATALTADIPIGAAPAARRLQAVA